MEHDHCALSDVARGYQWLGHDQGVTEVTILHPDYHPGDKEWNQAQHSWPRTTYLHKTGELLQLVRTYAGHRLIMYGINPRTQALRYQNGRYRSAKENDITTSQSLLLDIDLLGPVTADRRDRLCQFLDRADEYITTQGLARPVRAYTGRGSHLLFAYNPIPVNDCPDIHGRLTTFKNAFASVAQYDLDRLEARVDSTQDLRRMVRVYGTSKPAIGALSHFCGPYRRQPDPQLREHLLQLPPARTPSRVHTEPLIIADRLPEWFTKRLQNDHVLNELWHGRGKTARADSSTSGYDFTIAAYLAQHTTADNHVLGTIIALRPVGFEQRVRKGASYVQRTIAAVRQSRKFGD